MADLKAALVIVTVLEGGAKYVDHPDDPGGPTKYGISLAYLKHAHADWNGDGDLDSGDINMDGVIDARDIRAITEDIQNAFFREEFWRFDGVISQRIANRLLSFSVVRGLENAVRGIQRAVNALQKGRLAEDGVWGPNTQGAVNALDEAALFGALGLEMENQFWSITSSSVSTLAKKYFWPDQVFRRANVACARRDLGEVEIVRKQLLALDLRPGHLSNIAGWLNRVKRC